MVDPRSVNQSEFHLKEVLYEDEFFAIAWGRWRPADPNGWDCLGVRWNVTTEYPIVGYPTGAGGRPVWLVFPQNQELNAAVVQALLGIGNVDADAVNRVLS